MEHLTFNQQVIQHGANLLPRLRRMSIEDLTTLLQEVEALNQSTPLRYILAPKFIVKTWDNTLRLSGPEVVALYVFALWVQANVDEKVWPELIQLWPDLAETKDHNSN